MTRPPASQDLAESVVEALIRDGVRDVVLAPGSRSAPMAYALTSAEAAGALRLYVVLDERSAGFVALGLAVATGQIVPVVVTSGSAVANLHPAVVEAGHQRVPYLAISTDRPAELVARGASQTTQHLGLFGAGDGLSRPRAAVEIATAEAAAEMVADLLVRARGPLPGPVHLNLPFTEPLVPQPTERRWSPQSPEGSKQLVEASEPVEPAHLADIPETVVIAADGSPPWAARFAERYAFPLLAEPSSGVRGSDAVSAPPVLLDALGHTIRRAVVFGRPTLSRQVSAMLSRSDIDVVLADPVSRPWLLLPGATHVPQETLNPMDRPDSEAPATPTDFTRRWREASAAIDAALDAAADTETALAGWQVAREVSRAMVGSGTLVAGASMAIRELDLAMVPGSRVVANRGLAGIDGTVSTAVGHALAAGEVGGGVRALIGDLTLQHDLGGLVRGRLERPIDLQVVVLNDDGGSIFATLEHGRPEYESVHERIFATPQRLDLTALAQTVGASYHRVLTPADLRAVLAEPVIGVSIVDVRLRRPRAAGSRAALRSALRSAVADLT